MSKKILSVMLALVMTLSVFSIASFAMVDSIYEPIDEVQGQVAYTQNWSLVTDNTPVDGVYTVDVVLATDYATGPISFVYTIDGGKVVGVEEGDAILSYNSDIRESTIEGKNIVYIIPEPADESTPALELAAGSVVAKVKITLDAGVDAADFALVYDPKTSDNAGDLIAARSDDATLACDVWYCGQRVVDENGTDVELEYGDALATVTVGEEEVVAEPVLTGANTSVVIDTKKTFGGNYTGAVYGLTCSRFTATNVKNQFKVENGTIDFAAGSGGNGTGSKILVYNLAGELVSTYVVVVFGDVTGDGAINGPDLTKLKAHVTKPALVSGTPEFMAANLTASFTRSPNGPDLTMMKARVTSASAYSQGDMAQNHTSYSN